jgi:DNA-binding transcriptional regulator LsrR (DeoR family)
VETITSHEQRWDKYHAHMSQSETGVGREIKSEDLPLALEVARRYYTLQQNKVEIAAALDVTRFKVARLLQQCLDNGIVHVTITPPGPGGSDIEQLLRTEYDLQHVVVVDPPLHEPEPLARKRLGEAAAGLLMRLVTERDVVGFGWGRTMQATADAVTALPSCPIVQLGGMAGNLAENSTELVRRLAAVSRGKAYPLYAPLLLPDGDTREGLLRQQGIAATVKRFADVTVAVVAVGSWDPPNSQLRTALSAAEQRRLTQLGVRAEVCAALLDDNGEPLADSVTDRMLAIGAGQLRRIPTVIAAAGGESKVLAIRSVLLGRLATSLVTDRQAAQKLLSLSVGPGSTPAH